MVVVMMVVVAVRMRWWERDECEVVVCSVLGTGRKVAVCVVLFDMSEVSVGVYAAAAAPGPVGLLNVALDGVAVAFVVWDWDWGVAGAEAAASLEIGSTV